MEQMQKKLPEIMLQKPDTYEDEDKVGGGDSEANPEAEEPNEDVNRNEDAHVEAWRITNIGKHESCGVREAIN